MRPDEYAATDAERFTEALAFRNAIEEGREQVRDETEADRELKRMLRGK